MEFLRRELPAFSVIGIEGSTDDGEGFVRELWKRANARFSEIAPLVRRGVNGAPEGVWGLMSDKTRAFLPWQNGFTEGLYLAGAEVTDDAEPPEGWTKWTSPAYEYVLAPMDAPDAFARAIQALDVQGFSLLGAAYDRTDLETGINWMYFPIRRK